MRRRQGLAKFRMPVAAVCLIGLGWLAHSATGQLYRGSHTVDENFILSAREALRVAQLNGGPAQADETKQVKLGVSGCNHQHRYASTAIELEHRRCSAAALE